MCTSLDLSMSLHEATAQLPGVPDQVLSAQESIKVCAKQPQSIPARNLSYQKTFDVSAVTPPRPCMQPAIPITANKQLARDVSRLCCLQFMHHAASLYMESGLYCRAERYHCENDYMRKGLGNCELCLIRFLLPSGTIEGPASQPETALGLTPSRWRA